MTTTYLINADEFAALKRLLAGLRKNFQPRDLAKEYGVLQDFVDDCEFLDKTDRKYR